MPTDDISPAPAGPMLGDEIYSLLGEAILDGRLAPGERLRDQELAERLGVSRTPVREALQRLEVIGLVEVSPNRYTRVSTPTPQTRSDTRDFVTLMMGNAALLAATRCDDATLAKAVRVSDALVAASRAEDDSAMLARLFEVCMVITPASRNAVIRRLIDQLRPTLRRNLSGDRTGSDVDAQQRTSAYEDFRDGLAARDGARAEQALRRAHGLA